MQFQIPFQSRFDSLETSSIGTIISRIRYQFQVTRNKNSMFSRHANSYYNNIFIQGRIGDQSLRLPVVYIEHVN